MKEKKKVKKKRKSWVKMTQGEWWKSRAAYIEEGRQLGRKQLQDELRGLLDCGEKYYG